VIWTEYMNLFNLGSSNPLMTPLRVNHPNIPWWICIVTVDLINTRWKFGWWISQGSSWWIHFTRKSNEIHQFAKVLKIYNYVHLFILVVSACAASYHSPVQSIMAVYPPFRTLPNTKHAIQFQVPLSQWKWGMEDSSNFLRSWLRDML